MAIPPGDHHGRAGNSQGFDLPVGATLLAPGTFFPNHSYRVGASSYGFQFDREVTRPILDLRHEMLADNGTRPGAHDIAFQNECFELHNDTRHDWYTNFLDGFFLSAGKIFRR